MGIMFEGEYKNGLRWNGKGKEIEKTYGGGDIKMNIVYINGFKIYQKGIEIDHRCQIIYKGEYYNGKRNGKGKEYYCHNLIFEGEYLNEHKKIGKEYTDNRLEYAGGYLYNKKWNGKGYDKDGNIIYELKNGTGKIKLYEDGRLFFEGEHINGIRNGKGKIYDINNMLIFEGEYVNGEPNGFFKEYDFFSGKLIFEGKYLNGKKNGKGKEYNHIGNLI